eukprot:TRINITY_DN10751_c0_g1_i1.p1 TRINITY_DN10751_c0_g1~~TRINITY_DN10751_c0_g1_i1.p1  ORF type:complete len:934 (+),score=278.27 TRINITY_DN10751_c0_g1_i1:77-2878(+)
MSARKVPPPVKAKPKQAPAIKPKPKPKSDPTPQAEEDQPVQAPAENPEQDDAPDVTPTAEPPADPAPSRPPKPTNPDESSKSEPAAHANMPEHELYGNITKPETANVSATPSPPPLMPRGREAVEHTYENTNVERPAVIESDDEDDGMIEAVNAAPHTHESVAKAATSQEQGEETEAATEDSAATLTNTDTELTNIDSTNVAHVAGVEDKAGAAQPGASIHVTEEAGEQPQPSSDAERSRLKTETQRRLLGLYSDLNSIVTGDEANVRKNSLAASLATALRKQARESVYGQAVQSILVAEESDDDGASDNNDKDDTEKIGNEGGKADTQPAIDAQVPASAEAADNPGSIQRQRETTKRRLGMALSTRRKGSKTNFVKPQETAEAPDVIAAVPEEKRLELMEQVKSGKLTVQQMDAQLQYLAQQNIAQAQVAETLAETETTNSPKLAKKQSKKKKKKRKSKGGVEPARLRMLMDMVSKGMITQAQMADEVARLLLQQQGLPTASSLTSDASGPSEVYGAPVKYAKEDAEPPAQDLYGVKVKTVSPLPPVEDIYEETRPLGPPAKRTEPSALSNRTPASIRGRKPAPLPQQAGPASMQPALAAIDPTPPAQTSATTLPLPTQQASTDVAAAAADADNGIYASTDEALYGSVEKDEISPDMIAAVPQEERIRLMLQVKAGTITLRQMNCLLLNIAQERKPSIPQRPPARPPAYEPTDGLVGNPSDRPPLASPQVKPVSQPMMAEVTTEIIYDDGVVGSAEDDNDDIYGQARGTTYRADESNVAQARSRPPSLLPRPDDDGDDRWRHAAVPSKPPPRQAQAPVEAKEDVYVNTSAMEQQARQADATVQENQTIYRNEAGMTGPTMMADEIEEYSVLPPGPSTNENDDEELYADLRAEMQSKAAASLTQSDDTCFDDALNDALAILSMVAQEACELDS